ncbi:MAG: glycosyltransferase, partial [Rariglobus sp.]
TVQHYSPREWKGLFAAKADIVIHLERIFPVWRWKGNVNFLIPNQERFPRRHVKRLKHADHVLCKTSHARDVFSKLHGSVHLIGFTSPDRCLGAVQPDYEQCFHLAGRSTVKGTGSVIEAWKRHPEWPELVLVQHPDNAPQSVPPNVSLLSRVVPDAELRRLQSTCGIHVCTSLSEGWGHYIVEAMSCSAVVITTDGPPMNELVQPQRGILVGSEVQKPRHLGTDFLVSVDGLEKAVQSLLLRTSAEKESLGRNAREWFEENDRRFRETLVNTIDALTR